MNCCIHTRTTRNFNNNRYWNDVRYRKYRWSRHNIENRITEKPDLSISNEVLRGKNRYGNKVTTPHRYFFLEQSDSRENQFSWDWVFKGFSSPTWFGKSEFESNFSLKVISNGLRNVFQMNCELGNPIHFHQLLGSCGRNKTNFGSYCTKFGGILRNLTNEIQFLYFISFLGSLVFWSFVIVFKISSANFRQNGWNWGFNWLVNWEHRADPQRVEFAGGHKSLVGWVTVSDLRVVLRVMVTVGVVIRLGISLQGVVIQWVILCKSKVQ